MPRHSGASAIRGPPSADCREHAGWARAVHKLLRHTLTKWPELVEPARAILRGEEPSDFDPDTVDSIRSAVHTVLGMSQEVKARKRTAPADTPLRADIIEAWGLATDDPDATTIADWLDNGAPLGISQAIPSRGVFPKVSSHNVTPHSQLDARTLEGWSNYPSAEEEAETLEELISDYCVLPAGGRGSPGWKARPQ